MVGLFSSHSGSKNQASSCHEEGRVFLATAEGRNWPSNSPQERPAEAAEGQIFP